MADWGMGYVTDLAYMGGLYPVQAPNHLDLVLRLNGIAPPLRNGGFTYCELGCGTGQTIAAIAAAHPEAEFHAVDFNPVHIAELSETVRAAELGNLTVHEASFESLLNPAAAEMPMFDYVTLHGVYTWVGPEQRSAIRRFLGQRLRPGGVVGLGYNALPGWSAAAPLQRLLLEYAKRSSGGSDRRAATAIEGMRRLRAAGSPYLRDHTVIERMVSVIDSADPRYVVHEYLNDHWAAEYHVDLARALAESKLVFAGSGRLLENFSDFVTDREQAAAIEDVDDRSLRETLHDYCHHNPFREDVFVRGARRHDAVDRDRALSELLLVRHRNPEEEKETLELEVRSGRATLSEEAYRPMLARLDEGPVTVGELVAIGRAASPGSLTPVEVAGVLVGATFAAPFQPPGTEAAAAARRLNQYWADSHARLPPDAQVPLAVPGLSIGCTMQAIEAMVAVVLSDGGPRDPVAMAERLWAPYAARGEILMHEGRPMEDAEARNAALAGTIRRIVERYAGRWKQWGLIE